jgi:hypothetical protein
MNINRLNCVRVRWWRYPSVLQRTQELVSHLKIYVGIWESFVTQVYFFALSITSGTLVGTRNSTTNGIPWKRLQSSSISLAWLIIMMHWLLRILWHTPLFCALRHMRKKVFVRIHLSIEIGFINLGVTYLSFPFLVHRSHLQPAERSECWCQSIPGELFSEELQYHVFACSNTNFYSHRTKSRSFVLMGASSLG